MLCSLGDRMQLRIRFQNIHEFTAPSHWPADRSSSVVLLRPPRPGRDPDRRPTALGGPWHLAGERVAMRGLPQCPRPSGLDGHTRLGRAQGSAHTDGRPTENLHGLAPPLAERPPPNQGRFCDAGPDARDERRPTRQDSGCAHSLFGFLAQNQRALRFAFGPGSDRSRTRPLPHRWMCRLPRSTRPRSWPDCSGIRWCTAPRAECPR
jgi:hypothetical protein